MKKGAARPGGMMLCGAAPMSSSMSKSKKLSQISESRMVWKEEKCQKRELESDEEEGL